MVDGLIVRGRDPATQPELPIIGTDPFMSIVRTDLFFRRCSRTDGCVVNFAETTMTITIEKRGDHVIVLNADEPIPENEKMVLFTEKEIAKRLGFTPMEFAQLETVFREHEDDWGDSLEALTLPAPDASQSHPKQL